MAKIFVRERRHVGQGAGRPRFAVVAVHGAELRLHRSFLRRAELEEIAQETGANIIYLPRGQQDTDEQREGEKGRRHRRARAGD
jgi:hypothetical protein